MIVFALFLLAFSLLIGWMLILAYHETEEDFPPVIRRQRPLVAEGLSTRPTVKRGPQ
jgi:hypothetical protein